ncbi:hypothetical protein HPP92_025687 [Vanilla planifolia]|uniref:non-specific serine/threonine protein kinase n=1 Tax=Vanilla planifolia TaxID=51239 RepID=A0A835U990_VANPL|nr:hypothetical protein HPP92_025687 [Vanilla planifolia]
METGHQNPFFISRSLRAPSTTSSQMAVAGASSELHDLSSPEVETTWHLLTILMRFGCPARPAELAIRSDLAEDFVVRLCSIPGSAVILTDGGFVCPSDVALAALWRFVARAIDWGGARDESGVPGLRRRWSKAPLVYSRKRKACSVLDDSELALSSKERGIFAYDMRESSKGAELQKLPSQLNATRRKVYFDLSSRFVGVNALGCRSVVSENFDMKIFDYIGVDVVRKKFFDHSYLVVPHTEDNDFSSYETVDAVDVGVNACIPDVNAIKKFKIAEPHFRTSLQEARDQSSLLKHSINIDNPLPQLGINAGISESDAFECLNIIGPEFGEFPLDGVLNLSKLHQRVHEDQTDSPLIPRNEVIDVTDLHPKDEARLRPARMVEPVNIFKQKQKNLEPLKEAKSYITSRKEMARSIEASFISKNKAKILQNESMPFKDSVDTSKASMSLSIKKLMPNLELVRTNEEECSDAGKSDKGREIKRLPSQLNETPRKIYYGHTNHSTDINGIGCHSIVSEQAHIMPISHQNFSERDLNIFNYIGTTDIKKSCPNDFNSLVPCKEAKDFLDHESVALDMGVNACIPEELEIKKMTMAEPCYRSSLPGALAHRLLLNHSIEEDCDYLSLQLGINTSFPESDAVESLNMTRLEFGESLLGGESNQSMMHQGSNNGQIGFSLTTANEDIDVNNLHPKDDKFHCTVLPKSKRTLLASSNNALRVSCAVNEGAKNVVSIDARLRVDVMDESTNVSKQKHKNFMALDKEKSSSVKKLMPNFESYVIKEEEGSGGYGTVYKAQRKEDGKIFAIKCPHANAHSLHVNNELKMLERFGGRNFIIKYESSFKNGESECFVLEHIEHDRPEVLKKEISLFELQWYGYCMFRALASLHKQVAFIRKMCNFAVLYHNLLLFVFTGCSASRCQTRKLFFSHKLNKGFLIDFNLACDLHQKFCRSSKQKMSNVSMSAINIECSKVMNSTVLEKSMKEATNDSNNLVASKSGKKKANQGHGNGFPISHGSQTSGVTSAKDQTSAKTPVDWSKQPFPSKGRKELISFVHQAMHHPQNYKSASSVSSQRKRIRAPMGKTDARLIMLTPMPLFSGVNPIAGAGMLKNRGYGKNKKEGPCVGTKGFRAPEVLFKSFHQGCKLDVWSAGVTLLYLMIGRAPFGGDPELNIKEIAKLRGSEDLWEVANLHNCESAFPVDLLDVDSLKSMELRNWCVRNTKRPEFIDLIPDSLWDLVDRCLVVNPRCRLSAEDALMHKFFGPCHESMRKQRPQKKMGASDPSCSNS